MLKIGAFGVVLPYFLVMLVIAAPVSDFLKYKSVTAFLQGVRPAVVGITLSGVLGILFYAF